MSATEGWEVDLVRPEDIGQVMDVIDIDALIAKPTPLASLPTDVQTQLVSLTFSAFGEWRLLYDKYGPESSSRRLSDALGKYQGMETLMGYLICHQRAIFPDLLAAWNEVVHGLSRGAEMYVTERLRRQWVGAPSS